MMDIQEVKQYLAANQVSAQEELKKVKFKIEEIGKETEEFSQQINYDCSLVVNSDFEKVSKEYGDLLKKQRVLEEELKLSVPLPMRLERLNRRFQKIREIHNVEGFEGYTVMDPSKPIELNGNPNPYGPLERSFIAFYLVPALEKTVKEIPCMKIDGDLLWSLQGSPAAIINGAAAIYEELKPEWENGAIPEVVKEVVTSYKDASVTAALVKSVHYGVWSEISKPPIGFKGDYKKQRVSEDNLLSLANQKWESYHLLGMAPKEETLLKEISGKITANSAVSHNIKPYMN